MGNGRRSGRSRKSLRNLFAPAAVVALVFGAAVLTRVSPGQLSAQAAAPSVSHTTFDPTLNVGASRVYSRPGAHSKPTAKSVLGKLPLIFEPNQGQATSGFSFISRGPGYGLFLEACGATLALQRQSALHGRSPDRLMRMKLVGANTHATIAGANLLPGKSNYFVGNDPARWRSGIPQYGSVRYQGVYPGIDLVFYGNQGHLEYDFRVAPGADPSRAELEFDGDAKLQLSHGDLLVRTEKTDQAALRLLAPHIYQRKGERRERVDGRFVLAAGNRVSFELGAYDHSRELIIDPALVFSTYFGSIVPSSAPSVAVDQSGFIYLAGSTTGTTTFPLTGVTPTTLGSAANVFVAKINPTSPPSIAYATFLGGNGTDSSAGVAVDQAGTAYVVGNTTSTDFPTTSLAYETAPTAKGSQCSGISCTSLFVSALNSAGTALNYSSYISGNGNDVASGMTVDTNQDVLITGTTTSNNAASNILAFPATLVPVPFQSAPFASIQFFVTKVNTRVPGIGSIAYSTFFGGSLPANPVAIGGGVAVDTTGNIFFSGTTNFYNSGSGNYGSSGSGDFPIDNAYQPCLDTVPPTSLPVASPCTAPTTTPYPTDGFLAKINPNVQGTSQLLFSSYFGGSGADTASAITIDSGAANIYVTGSTNSPDFFLPTTQIFQTCLNTPGVTVTTTSACPATTTNTDAYIVRFTNPSVSTTGIPNFLGLTYFSYLGGSGNETSNSIAVDTANDALITGSTNSTNLPVTTPGAIQSALKGTQNSFFGRLYTSTTTTSGTAGSYVTYFGGSGVDTGTSIAVDQNLNTYFAGNTTSGDFQVVDSLSGPGGATLDGTNDAFVVKLATESDLCITCVPPVVTSGSAGAGGIVTVSAGSPVSITFTVLNNGPDVATNITVTGMVPTGASFSSGSVQTAFGNCSGPSGTSIECLIPALQSGSSANVVLTVTATNPGNYSVSATAASANNTNTNNTGTASFSATSFNVAIAPSAQTVAAGNAVQYSVSVSPTQGVFGANISLTCSALPTGASCNFTTSTITLGSGAGSASTILNVTTTAQPVNTASNLWHGRFYALWLTVPGMAFLGLGAGGKRRRTWILGLIALIAFFAVTLLQPACSSAKTQPTVSGTPSGTYPLTVTATSGTLTKTAPFTLTVIP